MTSLPARGIPEEVAGAAQGSGSREVLAARARRLERRDRLIRETDAVVEGALDGPDLAVLFSNALPLLTEALGAKRSFIEALGDGRTAHPEGPTPDPLPDEDGFRPDHRLVVRGLVVGGQRLGVAGAVFEEAPEDPEHVEDLLEAWVEVLDDHLAMVGLARAKHGVSRDVSRALADPHLERGLDRALEILASAVRFDDLVLVFRPADGAGVAHRRWVSVREDGGLEGRSEDPRFADHVEEILDGDLAMVLAYLGLRSFRQEEILYGARSPRVIGRLLVGRRDGSLGREQRDLVQVFADCLRQRLVDFSREHAQLSTCFPPMAVARLLREPGYRERFLGPREEQVAILYADIAGFTRISEQRLGTPSLIATLVDTWADHVVEAIWATGGVFDKMVGDCVIGLWGPPFFESSAERRCESAVEAARRIRLVTQELPAHFEEPALRELSGELGVAVGVNFAPLFVGYFGPNDNYTGFSSGMNNAARLQGLAVKDQILCMEAVCDRVPAPFGPAHKARVKNVGYAITYRELLES